jgi:hypothetical protein
MHLDIRRITCNDLCATGKNDALTPLILRRTKDIVGSLDIVAKERWKEVGVRIGRCREMDNGIDVSAGLPASVEISNIKWIDRMALTPLSNQRSRILIS